ncbi:hypothetical protein GIB67_037026 [Kingdonia uniflora]|uniref:Uncharacterized protein n=1 Tax=Kingdonia uniflora TaxID=39325 RepID=A0A7J7LHS7_9MAGN|nr:hypothetical protein GIB67_037026 [Kingdonia uniflora]
MGKADVRCITVDEINAFEARAIAWFWQEGGKFLLVGKFVTLFDALIFAFGTSAVYVVNFDEVYFVNVHLDWVNSRGGLRFEVRTVKITGKIGNILVQMTYSKDEFERALEGETFVGMVTVTFLISAVRFTWSDFDRERDMPNGVCLYMWQKGIKRGSMEFEYASIAFMQSRFSIFRDSLRNLLVKASSVSLLDFLKLNRASTLTSLYLLKANWVMKSCVSCSKLHIEPFGRCDTIEGVKIKYRQDEWEIEGFKDGEFEWVECARRCGPRDILEQGDVYVCFIVIAGRFGSLKLNWGFRLRLMVMVVLFSMIFQDIYGSKREWSSSFIGEILQALSRNSCDPYLTGWFLYSSGCLAKATDRRRTDSQSTKEKADGHTQPPQRDKDGRRCSPPPPESSSGNSCILKDMFGTNVAYGTGFYIVIIDKVIHEEACLYVKSCTLGDVPVGEAVAWLKIFTIIQ